MLRIQAITFNSRPLASPVATEFDERGGTIGRAADSTLMLHDEKQCISRTHAMISFSGGSYILRDLGSATPTFVNGAPVGKGNEIALRDGDEIRIGDYVFSVTEQPVAGPIPEDPFADLLPPSAPAGAPSQPSPPPPIGQLDSMEDPFAVHQRRSAAPSASATSGGIPDDFDPFAETTSPSQAAPAQQLPDDELGLGGSTQPSVDSIFGLRAGESWDPLAPGNPLAAPQGGLDATSNDPFAGLGAPTPPVSPRSAQPDHASMLSGAFRPPQAKFEQPAPAAMPSQPAPQGPKQPAAPHANDMVVSWDTRTSAGAVIKTAIVSAPKRAPQQGARVAQAAPSAPATTAAPRVMPEQAPGTATAVDGDVLVRAFLTGAGMAELRIPGGVTPEFMTLIGRLLHEAVRGTLELLLARALTKREVGAQATVIVARENNPLKFSPNVEAALSHLLTQQGHGFMTPPDAVRDAYNDLRSHQFGFMAGMRAALEGVLARFDPAQLEQRLSGKSVLGSLLPSSRRAKLWELYEQLYRDISREAEDDFQRLFGKEFLRAYEAQIEKLEQEDAGSRR